MRALQEVSRSDNLPPSQALRAQRGWQLQIDRPTLQNAMRWPYVLARRNDGDASPGVLPPQGICQSLICQLHYHSGEADQPLCVHIIAARSTNHSLLSHGSSPLPQKGHSFFGGLWFQEAGTFLPNLSPPAKRWLVKLLPSGPNRGFCPGKILFMPHSE